MKRPTPAGALVLFLTGASILHAFPPTLDIGAFAIDNYAGNGGGYPNMSYQIGAGQNFFWGANAQVPGYSTANSGGTSGPNLALDVRDNAVTKAAITSTNSGYGNREYCDFVFYGGHGSNGSLYLGAGGSYGAAQPAELNFGVGFNRWFLAHSCHLFNVVNPAAHWQPAFKGLKAMLGFKSLMWDNYESWALFNEFWLNWTYRERSLLMAFFNAEANYGYKHLYPSAGLEPGCLSAQVPYGRIDYCRESFRWAENNYNKATANSGYYYNLIIGSPQY